MTVLGRHELPPARIFSPGELVGGKEDSQWLALRGIVRSAAIRPAWGRSVLFLDIDIGAGGVVTARVHDFAQGELDHLRAATVTVKGVCGTVFNDKRQFVGLRLFVASLDDLKIEKPAPSEPFDLPTAAFDSLLNFDEQAGAINQVKVKGVVTFSKPGGGLYLQDGNQGLFIQSGQSSKVTVGSQVEAAGYPAGGRYSPILENAVFRVVGASPTVKPLVKSAAELVVVNDGFSSAPYDSLLVQVQGKLIEEIVSGDEDRLLLKEGATVFTAKLGAPIHGSRSLAAGSLLRITGICVANADEAHEVRSFDLLVRDPQDIVVFEGAPWWTATHATWIVGLLVVLVLGMSGWVAMVKRQADLRALAVTDPLTGLYNRRGFLLLAEQQWRVALRGSNPFLLFYIDVDKFKSINDSLGHKEGDITLITIADLLRQCFRKADILARMGGDEFAVTAIEATERSSEILERRIRSLLQRFNETSGKPYQLSLSLGILTCDSSLIGASIEDLLARADSLMYLQKRNHQSDVDLLPKNL